MRDKARARLLLMLTWLARRYPQRNRLWVRLANRFVFVDEDKCRTN